jgi:hypothetical protein
MWVYYMCDEEAIKTVFAKLPVVHMFGDLYSVLEDGSTIQDHESYCPKAIRNEARSRSVVFQTDLHSIGGYGPIAKKPVHSQHVLVCLTSVLDWCDTDGPIFKLSEIPLYIGSLPFDAYEYMRTIIQDVSLALKSVKNSCSEKVWLKIAPLAMSPSIQTKEGIAMAPVASFWYMQALSIAIGQLVRDSWVHTLEIVDFFGLLHSMQLNVPKVRIYLPSTRDILDFRGCPPSVLPAVIVPVDSFSSPWKHKTGVYDSLATAVCNNTNLVHETHDPIFVKTTF